jgi:serine protease Do
MWGNSNDAKVGYWVVAVGNPFGVGGSATAGIISALKREISEGPYDPDHLTVEIERRSAGVAAVNQRVNLQEIVKGTCCCCSTVAG